MIDVGVIIGNYQILEEVGIGGMGKVYRGLDTMLDREVAIKVLRPELTRHQSLVERFRNEAMVLAKLSHPHIAMLYNLIHQDDLLFMVMEFVRGETLDTLIRRSGALPYDQAIRFFGHISEAIGYAHDHGVIHRDLKPGNIMITPESGVKVMDFGIARVLGSERMTREGSVIGTLEYMAPEQIRGHELSERTDIYSLGILLYEMLVGRLPFSSVNQYDLMQAHIETPPPPPRSFAPHLPEYIEEAILRALAKNPSERFVTVMEFREILIGNDHSPSTGFQTRPLRETAVPQDTPETGQRQFDVERKDEVEEIVAETRQRLIEEARKRGEEEAAKFAEEERQRLIEEARKQAEQEAARLGEEARQKLIEEARKLVEQEAERLAEERKRLIDEARKQAQDDAHQRVSKDQQRHVQLAGEQAEEEAIRLAGEDRQQLLGEAHQRTEKDAAPQTAKERKRIIAQERKRAKKTAQGQSSELIAPSDPDGTTAPSEETPQARQESAAFVTPYSSEKGSLRHRLLLIVGGILVFVIALVVFFVARQSDNDPPKPSPPKNSPGMIRVTGGNFRMGRDYGEQDEEDITWAVFQMPAHEVSVPSFEIDRTEVSNEEYARFVSESGHRPPDDWVGRMPVKGQEKWPVRYVSLDDARAFAEWRSKRDGVTYRLPTEIEWEFAARGQNNYHYPWGDTWSDERANLDTLTPKPVGSYSKGASPFGVLDLIGNVSEWTSSQFWIYPGNTRIGAESPGSGVEYIIRGGSYVDSPFGKYPISVTGRDMVEPSHKASTLGFRLVRSVR